MPWVLFSWSVSISRWLNVTRAIPCSSLLLFIVLCFHFLIYMWSWLIELLVVVVFSYPVRCHLTFLKLECAIILFQNLPWSHKTTYSLWRHNQYLPRIEDQDGHWVYWWSWIETSMQRVNLKTQARSSIAIVGNCTRTITKKQKNTTPRRGDSIFPIIRCFFYGLPAKNK